MTYKTEKTEPISKHDYFRTISDCLDKLEITQSNSETSSAPNTSSKQQAIEIEKFFAAHKVSISVVNINVGPVHTRFEIKPGPGVRIKRIKDLSQDLSIFLGTNVKEITPIPGKSVIGIDVLNKQPRSKDISEDLKSTQIISRPFSCIPLGICAPHEIQFVNLNETPNLLIAGTSKSGKTTCLTSIIQSSICRATQDELKLILMEGLTGSFDDFEGIPHLLFPIVSNRAKTIDALSWVTDEYSRRLQLFKDEGVKNITEYYYSCEYRNLPLVIIFIDDYDLIVKEQCSQINQFMINLLSSSYKAGIHFIVSTTSPLSDAIGGTFKSLFKARATYKLSSSSQSVSIIEQGGAEKLCRKGEMLFRNDRGEINHIDTYRASTLFTLTLSTELSRKYPVRECEESVFTTDSSDLIEDALLDPAVDVILEYGSASVSLLQRRLGVGYPRAAHLIDEMERAHIIGPYEGTSPRKVLITRSDWDLIRNTADSQHINKQSPSDNKESLFNESVNTTAETQVVEQEVDQDVKQNKTGFTHVGIFTFFQSLGFTFMFWGIMINVALLFIFGAVLATCASIIYFKKVDKEIPRGLYVITFSINFIIGFIAILKWLLKI